MAATGAQLLEVVKAMESSVGQYPADHVLMACIGLGLMIINPKLSIEDIQEGIFIVSGQMKEYADAMTDGDDDEPDDEPLPPNLVN